MEIFQMQRLDVYDRVGGSMTMCSHFDESVVVSAQSVDNHSPIGFTTTDVVINRDDAPSIIAYLKDVFSL